MAAGAATAVVGVLIANRPLSAQEVVGAAVQSATPDRVTQLALLQGQRGVEGHERFLSATLQVTFAKVGRSWLVDDVTVVAAPPAEEHK